MSGLAIATVLGNPGAVRPAAPPAPARADCAAAPAASDAGFVETLLPRHGMRPLGFRGRLLVEAGMARDAAEPALALVSRVAIHETEQGALVGSIRHQPRQADMPALTYAGMFADCEALKAWLAAHDPLADLPVQVILPAGEAAADAGALAHAGQELVQIRLRFKALLAALVAPPCAASPGFDDPFRTPPTPTSQGNPVP